MKPLAYKQWEDDWTSDRVPVEEWAGDLQVMAGEGGRPHSPSESESEEGEAS